MGIALDPEKLRELEALEAEANMLEERALSRAAIHYPDFAQRVIRDAKTGDPIKVVRLQERWFEHIAECWSRGLYAAIAAPYGSGKTTHFGLGLPLFALGLDPTLRIKLVSASDDVAAERVDLNRQYIDESEELHEVFPNLRRGAGKWTADKIYVARSTRSNDASLHALGATATSVGGRADMLILDDINDLRNTIQFPKMREVVWRNFGFLTTRLEPGAKVCWILTRYHEDDCMGRLLDDPDMRRKWGILIQRVNEDFNGIDVDVLMGDGGNDKRPIKKDQLTDLIALYRGGII